MELSLTGVRSSFSAAHCGDDGILHGHSYNIWAWFEAGPDALVLQERLTAFVKPLDHTTLAPGLSTGEAIARHAGYYLGATRVVVERPVEGLAAEWSR